MSDASEAITKISEAFLDIASNPESETIAVLLLHDVTGVKKKDVKAVLKYGCELSKIYGKEQDFKLNKTPKGKIGKKASKKKKRS